MQALLHAQRLIGGTVFGSAVKSAGGLRALWDRKTSETIYSVVDNIERNITDRYTPEESTRVLNMLEYLRERNLLDLTFSTEGRDVMREGYSAWERVMTASRAMAHLTEVNNRVITAHAAYQLAYDYAILEDGQSILNGGNTAATHFFKLKTSDKIYNEFKPVFAATMKEVGPTRVFEDIMGKAKTMPFMSKTTVDLDDYVTRKSTDGLFVMLGQQEKMIRGNPAARSTDLLKKVFGK